ncbi:MAG TPA: M56 family metallopeptidase [Thermoanaerobaculia bacterium]|nr:M56 family metallopeptidase [Thermoanaerobaculia bacterium]
MSALAAVGLGSGTLIEALLRTSLQGALFIAAVWLACRLFPRLPASVRCGLWWAACLKLLVGLVWIVPVELPLLPALTTPALLSRPLPPAPTGRGGSEIEQEAVSPDVVFPSPGEVGREGAGEGSGVRVREGAKRIGWTAILLLWLAGLALQSVRAFRQLRFTRGVVRRAEPLQEAWIRTIFAELCALLALRRQPDLRGSREVRTPQAIGLLRPLVLLPESGLARLAPAEISMTLCHELVHLRRRDLWLGWVPALAHRIFFFHPLAALAAREYAIAREAACDAEVLRVLGSAPQAYGRLLLRWGVAPRETGLAAAGASPSLQNLKRRLQMLQQSSDNKRRLSGWWWLAGAAVLAGLIPLRIVAQQPAPEAQAEPASEATEATAPAVAEAAEEAEPAEAPAAVAEGIPGGVVGGVIGGVEGAIPGGVKGGVAGGIPGGVVGGVAGGVPGGVAGALAPAAPRPAAGPTPGAAPMAAPALVGAPLPAAAPRPGAPLPAARTAWAGVPPGAPRAYAAAPMAPPAPPAPRKHGYSWVSSDDGDSWILLYGNDSASMMSGDMDDFRKLKRLRGDSKEAILWFRHDGREYVVRDPAVLKQAEEIFKPQMELGARQGALGARQGELGAKQGALGARQGQLGGQQGALGAQMAALSAERMGRDDDDATLERRERELEGKMEALGQQQEELGRQQEALGRQQEELGRQQEELGRQQEAAGEEAKKEIRTLMEQAVHSGAAQPVK